MLTVTRINGIEIHINPDLVMFVEATPDTVITLTNGDKWMVKESVPEVIQRFKTFKRDIQAHLS